MVVSFILLKTAEAETMTKRNCINDVSNRLALLDQHSKKKVTAFNKVLQYTGKDTSHSTTVS